MQCPWNLLLIYFSSGRSIAFLGRVWYPKPKSQTEDSRGSFFNNGGSANGWFLWWWLRLHPLSHCMPCPGTPRCPISWWPVLPPSRRGGQHCHKPERSVVKGALGQAASETLWFTPCSLNPIGNFTHRVKCTILLRRKQVESLICQGLTVSPSFESRTVQAQRICFYTTVLWLCTV